MTTATRTVLLDRVATAPISWGVCEVPGWRYQLPVDRVLTEMVAAGFTHTELGALGYLPTEPAELHRTQRGQSLGNWAKDELSQAELTQLMAGGAELEELQHELAQASPS